MIKHIVMWRLQPGDRQMAQAGEMKARLEALSSQIPEISQLQVGLNISPSERAGDIVLITDFEHSEALEAYRVHPAHQEVVAFVRGIAVETRAVDFEY